MKLNLTKFSTPKSGIRNPESIKNIIFDFGGVILNIDVKLTERAFVDLGLKKIDKGQSLRDSAYLFDKIETGAMSPGQFRDELRKFFIDPVTDDQLDAVWNALLLDIPEARIRLLETLRKDYRIFLLSNTNEIHYMKYLENLREQYGYADFDALFEKAYFSFRIGLKKPSPEIFSHVLSESMLKPSETLFIDDTFIHVEAAGRAGIEAYHLDIEDGENITALFQ
ncbi:MAG: HAD family phosphatase [Bacteroidales bacterium]|nr:HAD family phosphatase [Bacteroidales bacterium]